MECLWLFFRRVVLPLKCSSALLMSVITVVGVSLGVAVLTISYSVAKGFEKAYQEALSGFNAHVVILGRDEIADYQDLMVQLMNTPFAEDIADLSPFIYRETLLIHNGKIRGIVVKGIEKEGLRANTGISFSLFGPSSHSALPDIFDGDGWILLGRDLATLLAIKGEKAVRLLSPVLSKESVSSINAYLPFNVIGTFDSGLYDYNSQFAMVKLEDAQKFFGAKEKVTGIEIRLKDVSQTMSFSTLLSEWLNDDVEYQVIDWYHLNEELFRAVRLERVVFVVLMGIIVVVASFNIISTVIISIVERKKEIAILRVLGLRAASLVLMFLVYGAVIGMLGAGIGAFMGWFFAWAIGRFGLLRIDPSVYFLDSLPADISCQMVGVLFIVSTLICSLTSYVASKKLMRMEITEGLI